MFGSTVFLGLLEGFVEGTCVGDVGEVGEVGDAGPATTGGVELAELGGLPLWLGAGLLDGSACCVGGSGSATAAFLVFLVGAGSAADGGCELGLSTR